MVRISIRMLRVPLELFEFTFECFESLSNLKFEFNASNPFRKIQIYVRMFRIPFEWSEFPFEYFESLSNCLNLHSNASNPFRNGSNSDSNASNHFRMVRI